MDIFKTREYGDTPMVDWFQTPTDRYYETLSKYPVQLQMMVMHSRELERMNPKAAKKFLMEHPDVVMARQQAAKDAVARVL